MRGQKTQHPESQRVLGMPSNMETWGPVWLERVVQRNIVVLSPRLIGHKKEKGVCFLSVQEMVGECWDLGMMSGK